MDAQLERLVSGARYLTAFTGAGVSTLSGLPDFRSEGGFYSRPGAEKVFDLSTFRRDPSLYYRECRTLLYQDHDVSSSLVHHVLAQWQRQGILKALITQNIDLLHQKAGSTDVLEVHGSPLTHRCLACGASFSYEEIAVRVRAGDVPPLCSCGGVIKPDVTFFGEGLPPAFDRAQAEARRSDLMLVLGTSLTVWPAAGLPELTLARGGQVVIINAQPTHLDDQAVLVLRDLEGALGPS